MNTRGPDVMSRPAFDLRTQSPRMAVEQRTQLRRQLRAQRTALTPTARIAAAAALLDKLQSLARWHSDQHIAGYWAVGGEMLLHLATSACTQRGAQWLLPRLHGDRLRFAPWKLGDPVNPNRYGIPEPEVALDDCLAPDALDLVLVPVVGFDRRGNRLGSGAGFYDRSFSFLQHGERPRRPLLVGVAYAFAQLDALAAQPWDVALDYVCTERELIDCARERDND